MKEDDSPVTEWLPIGKIVAPQGMRGEVRVYPNTDFPERFVEPGKRWLQRPGQSEPEAIALERGRFLPGKGLYVIKIEGSDDRSAAEALRDCILLVPDDDRPSLDEDEYHVLDLIGMDVFVRPTGDRLGVVSDVITAANDLLEVNLDTGKKLLVPFAKAIVPIVDLEGDRIEIDPPPGLLDL